ncbi:arrestin domain-containing protein 3-like [Amphiura filiformis]|uniref:arrestin domain-containing protein 3-like n=1 Tax=Amphiura filiformis TaxID=82378 RepID=UPI003B21261F
MKESEEFSFQTGKLQIFEVLFDGDNDDIFRPGDWIQGFVRIVLKAPKKDIRGVSLAFKGKAKTKWSEREGSGDNRRTVNYYLKEKYFQEKLIIAGKDKRHNVREIVQLDAGEHRFPFRFYIPAAPLPYAFEGLHGYIRYYVKAKIERPWKFDHITYRLFSVVGAGLDLNRMSPELVMPRTAEAEKTLCCLCCASGPIKVTAHLEKSGYVPGEHIYVSATVDNRSSREILSFKAKLYQSVSFMALRNGTGQQHTKSEKQMLIMLQASGCGAFDTVDIERQPLPIPSCPSSGLVGCNIIHTDYYLEIDVDVSGTPFDAKIFFPITLGILPLVSSYSLPSAASSSGQVITEQPSASAYPELPPPSYEIAVGGLREIPSKSGYNYTFGKLLYAPRYPFYNFDEIGKPAPSSQQMQYTNFDQFFLDQEESTSNQGPPPHQSRSHPRTHYKPGSRQRMENSSPSRGPPPDQSNPPVDQSNPPVDQSNPPADQEVPSSPGIVYTPPSPGPDSDQEDMSNLPPDQEPTSSEGVEVSLPSQGSPPDQSMSYPPPDEDPKLGQDHFMQNSISSENVPPGENGNDPPSEQADVFSYAV